MKAYGGGLLAVVVFVSLLSVAGVGVLCGCLSAVKRKREDEASEIWKSISLRNGVSERLPWHDGSSVVNAPGLVSVRPGSESLPVHPWEVAPQASVTLESQNLDGNSDSGVSELVNEPELTPLEFGETVTDEERSLVRRFVGEGLSQNASIKKIWGIKPGGSSRYKAARSRYQQLVSEVAANA